MKHLTGFGRSILLVFAVLGIAACGDDPAGVDDSAPMTIAFSAAGDGSSSLGDGFAASAASDVVVTGTNGTLTITDVAFIVGEFKLDRTESACDDDGLEGDDDDLGGDLDDDDDDDDCEEFEVGDYFVQLPLTGGSTQIVTTPVPAGTYVEMKFETEDVDLSEAEDDDDGAEIAALLADIAAAGYDNWPDDASLVVAGSFDPIDGEPREFVAYFDAEIKIELPFDPPLVIADAGGTVDIEVDPSAWFVESDGSVADLSAFDFETTGEVLEFEAKMDDGFTKIELEGFDDD